MSIIQEPIFQWLYQFVYEPQIVYAAVVGMMLASAFGFPLPEEVTLVSVGILAYMGSHPEQFPGSNPNLPHVNVHEAAAIAFLAVFLSDCIIYFIGRKYGRKLVEHQRLKRFFPEERLRRVEAWTKKYGAFACFIFRFTPGIRFPGHLACGMLRFEPWKFMVIDGFAAAISVPTQIYLLAFYGEPILKFLKEFKIVLFSLIALGIIYLVIRKYFFSSKTAVQ
jgi:membrane protein DedA with SNARE-associated domain